MSDEPFTAPNQKLLKRQPKPGEVLWSLTKGEDRCRAEPVNTRSSALELQLFLTDGRGEPFVYGQHYPIRALAVSEADRLFGAYLALGYKVTA